MGQVRRHFLPSVLLGTFFGLAAVLALPGCSDTPESAEPPSTDGDLVPRSEFASVQLPSPGSSGPLSLEEAIAERRSVRTYTSESLTLEEVGQLLWAAQGTTSEDGGRAAPSAGGLYPLEVYVVVGDVDGLDQGVYRYRTTQHALSQTKAGDLRQELSGACLDQEWIETAPLDLVLTGAYARTASKYGDRAPQYVHLEAGHAGQNAYLQAISLGLGTVSVGAFHDDEVRGVLGLPEEETPLYVMPVGRLPR